ncbi:winged helix-turn-helix domain-containing protein [Streptacidiphilus melanogenes]|uniref:winged helix-turn-helix domain-containing protein n=1 Tax=Streptacidiphilus melanogenes TaxID=411235 RepID=UPI0005A699EB|nr:winged helix-turn-helix domain-containing protein [Streptacidiphilus melanogenes]
MASKGVKELLQQRIEAGEWRAGESLPSAEQLAGELGVSRVTVQKALAALARDELIRTHPGRRAVLTGEHPRPADQAGDGPSVEEGAIEVLARHLARTLATGRFRVDALCVTAESFVTAVTPLLIRLRARRDRLSEFRIRLLFCDFRALPTFPRDLDEPDDLLPLTRLRQIAHAQVAALRLAAESLQTFQLLDTRPQVEIRTVPFPPMSKLYLLNDDEALEGWYELRERQVDVGDGHRVRLADLAGLSSRLFLRSRHALPNHVDSVYVDTARQFFESWWTSGSPYDSELE